MNESPETAPALEEEQEEGPASLDNDETLQKEVLGKLRTHNEKSKPNRMAQVCNAREQRLYFKGMQYNAWDEDSQDVIFATADDDDEPYSRTFNIFQAYGKIFMSTFMGAMPKVRAEADDPFESTSIRNTAKAATYERVYRKFNDTPTQQLEGSRLMWTDGRIVTRTAQRGDKEITEFWGVLESRLPVTAKDDIEVPLKNCLLIELEDEYPNAQLKKEYGDKLDASGNPIRKKISSGNGDNYERNARTAVKRQAGTDTAVDVMTGDDAYGLSTKTWSYMRPEFFEEFGEASRKQLEEKFPTGLCLVHSGDVYLESYECDPDTILDVIHALPGDGQARGSIGGPMMPLQDSANTGQNLIEETFDHGIPTIYYNTKTNIDGLNKQREMPGASRKAEGEQGAPLGNMFYATPTVNPSQTLLNYVEDVKGPQSQFATGQQPALFGGDMTDQKTASGYSQARTMALGQMAIVWKPWTAWFAREQTRAVKLASKRTDEIKTILPAQRKGGKPESVRLAPSDLQGMSFTNDSDENFPETWTEKSNKFMTCMQDPDMKQIIMSEPDNLYLAKDMLGLSDLVIPGEDLRNNVLSDISQMEHEGPQPDPAQMPATPLPPMGATPPPPPMVSSIQIDSDFLEGPDFETGWKTVKHWVQSSAGQEAKVSNPNWFENVRLYGLQYKQGMIAAQQAALPPPEPPDLPKVVMNYQDLPATGKVQAAAKANIQLSLQDVNSVPPAPTLGATNA